MGYSDTLVIAFVAEVEVVAVVVVVVDAVVVAVVAVVEAVVAIVEAVVALTTSHRGGIIIHKGLSISSRSGVL